MRLYDLFRISHGRLNQFLIFIFLINLRSYHRRTPPLFIYPPRTTSSIHLIFPIDKKFLANRPQINLPRTNERINVGNLRWIHTCHHSRAFDWKNFSKESQGKPFIFFRAVIENLAEGIHYHYLYE